MPDETALLPLSGIRVIELADARAEFVGRLLANLGADVIKVESPNGASSRSIGPYKDDAKHPERSLFWWHFNIGKRRITIDLNTTEGKRLLGTLLAPTDVLIESLGVAGLAKVGLVDWPTMHQENPALVVLSVSDFGLDGPWSDYQISELVAMALGGQMMTAGYAPTGDGTYDTPPMTPQMHQPINILGCLGTMDILAALAQRDITGQGQRIDLSVHAAVNGASENHLSWYIAAGVIAKRKPQFPLHQSKDGIYVQVMPSLFGEEWGRLANFLDHYGMAGDLLEPKYTSSEHRAQPEVHSSLPEMRTTFSMPHRKPESFGLQLGYPTRISTTRTSKNAGASLRLATRKPGSQLLCLMPLGSQTISAGERGHEPLSLENTPRLFWPNLA